MATYIYIGLLIVGVGIAIFGNLSLRRLHKIDQTYFSVAHEIIRLSGDEVIRFIEKVRGRIVILAKTFIFDGVLIGVLSGLKILDIFPNLYIATTDYLPLISILMVVLPILFFIEPYPRFGLFRPYGIIRLSKSLQ